MRVRLWIARAWSLGCGGATTGTASRFWALNRSWADSKMLLLYVSSIAFLHRSNMRFFDPDCETPDHLQASRSTFTLEVGVIFKSSWTVNDSSSISSWTSGAAWISSPASTSGMTRCWPPSSGGSTSGTLELAAAPEEGCSSRRPVTTRSSWLNTTSPSSPTATKPKSSKVCGSKPNSVNDSHSSSKPIVRRNWKSFQKVHAFLWFSSTTQQQQQSMPCPSDVSGSVWSCRARKATAALGSQSLWSASSGMECHLQSFATHLEVNLQFHLQHTQPYARHTHHCVQVPCIVQCLQPVGHGLWLQKSGSCTPQKFSPRFQGIATASYHHHPFESTIHPEKAVPMKPDMKWRYPQWTHVEVESPHHLKSLWWAKPSLYQLFVRNPPDNSEELLVSHLNQHLHDTSLEEGSRQNHCPEWPILGLHPNLKIASIQTQHHGITPYALETKLGM